MLRIIVVISSILFFESFAFSQDEYFLTLRYDKVNLRQGPSFKYPIKLCQKVQSLAWQAKVKKDNFSARIF